MRAVMLDSLLCWSQITTILRKKRGDDIGQQCFVLEKQPALDIFLDKNDHN